MADRKIDLSKKYWSPIREAKKRERAKRTHKWCNHCQQNLPLSAFYQPSASGLTGYSAYCRECCKAYQRERREKAHENRLSQQQYINRLELMRRRHNR